MPEPVTIITVGGGVATLGVHLARRYFDAAKEVCDVALGAVAFVLALPVMIFCASLIRLSSRGPDMYKQVRVGKDKQLGHAPEPLTMTALLAALAGIGGYVRNRRTER